MFWNKKKSKKDQALEIIKKGNGVLSATIHNGTLMVSTQSDQTSVKLKEIDWNSTFTEDGAINFGRKQGAKGAFTSSVMPGTNLVSVGIPCQYGKSQELVSLLKSIS